MEPIEHADIKKEIVYPLSIPSPRKPGRPRKNPYRDGTTPAEDDATYRRIGYTAGGVALVVFKEMEKRGLFTQEKIDWLMSSEEVKGDHDAV